MDQALTLIYYNNEDSVLRSCGEALAQREKSSDPEGQTESGKGFLADQQSYAFYKPDRRHLKRNRSHVKGIDAQLHRTLRTCRLLAWTSSETNT